MKPPKISVTGIDGSGKDHAVDMAAMLSIETGGFSSIGRMGNPNYLATSDNVTPIDAGSEKVERLRARADENSSRGLILAANGLHLVNQARMVYPKLVRQEPDAIIAARELVIDPIVYGRHYAGERAGRLALNSMKLLARAVGHKSDMIVWLDTEPETALARTQHRALEGHGEQPHETVIDLQRLREDYSEAIEHYRQEVATVPVVYIDTTQKATDEVADMVSRSLSAYIHNDIGGNDWEMIA